MWRVWLKGSAVLTLLLTQIADDGTVGICSRCFRIGSLHSEVCNLKSHYHDPLAAPRAPAHRRLRRGVRDRRGVRVPAPDAGRPGPRRSPASIPRPSSKAPPGHLSRVKLSREDLSIDFEKQLTYADGTTRLLGVKVTTTNRGDGRTFTVTAKEGEVHDNPTGYTVNGDVKLVASDGLTARTEHATYAESDATVRAPGPVEFARGRMAGTGMGMTYDKGAGRHDDSGPGGRPHRARRKGRRRLECDVRHGDLRAPRAIHPLRARRDRGARGRDHPGGHRDGVSHRGRKADRQRRAARQLARQRREAVGRRFEGHERPRHQSEVRTRRPAAPARARRRRRGDSDRRRGRQARPPAVGRRDRLVSRGGRLDAHGPRRPRRRAVDVSGRGDDRRAHDSSGEHRRDRQAGPEASPRRTSPATSSTAKSAARWTGRRSRPRSTWRSSRA